jgi:DNA-cytosine methyltransferase
MKILSLFDGISCARVALERVGIPVDAYYASEIERVPMEISARNYPDIIQLGDVKKITGNFGSIDLLIGGSPCQDLSMAGKKAGLAGAKSSLFYEYARILKKTNPRFFILENVAFMPPEAKK